MNDRLLKLERELEEVETWRNDLIKRLKQPQGAISDEEWVIMLHKKHAYDKHYSCVYNQYKQVKKEIEENE